MKIIRREGNYVLFEQNDRYFVGIYKKYNKNDEELWCHLKYDIPKVLVEVNEETFIERVKAFLLDGEDAFT